MWGDKEIHKLYKLSSALIIEIDKLSPMFYQQIFF